jgi:NADH:ubiquinone oxidoreductase subunit 6 (subunit J)
MAQVVFFIAALGAIAGAVGTVALRNPFYSVLALVCHLLALAALFLLLRAEFVAAAQVVVYAGAVMVLYVFVVAYVGGDQQSLAPPTGGGIKLLSALFGTALLVELLIAMLGSGLQVLDSEGTGFFAAFGTPAEIGRLFLTQFLVAFEIASLLLLIAAVGAVVLARRRAGLEVPPDTISVGQLLRGEYPGGPGAPAEAARIGAARAREGGW